MNECLFCNIASKHIPTEIVYEDSSIMCFNDIKPQAPIHLLIIPKKHISSINDFEDEDQVLLSKLLVGAKQIAKQLAINEKGYRLVFNINDDGGQTVHHTHLHLLGGRRMNWPPG